MATKALGYKLENSPNMLVVCRRTIIFVDSKSLTSNNEEGGRSRPSRNPGLVPPRESTEQSTIYILQCRCCKEPATT